MPSDDEAIARLSEALSALAAQDARELLDEARAEARTRVRELLCEALSDSLLAAVDAELERAPLAPQPPFRPVASMPAAPVPAAPVPAAPVPAPPVSAAGHIPGPHLSSRAAPGLAPRAARSALYVYGVVLEDGTDVERLPAGVEGGPVFALSSGGLSALVSEVAADNYEDEVLRQRLADADWVEATARRHEDVLDAVGTTTTVLPLRMCTVIESVEHIRERLVRDASVLRNAIAYLEGKTEWGVKVVCDPSLVTHPGGGSAREARGSSGAEYLQRRLRDREQQRALARQVEEAAVRIHERLSAVAADAVVAPVQRRLPGRPAAEMVLNGVYLVGDDARQRFHAQTDALAAEFAELGLELEATGPWPAYNFVPGAIGASW